MLDYRFKSEIESLLQPIMDEYFCSTDVKKLLKSKESGHTLGTIIEEKCGNILTENGYKITKEVNKLGEEKSRAHSDFNIVTSDGIVNRVNVKFSGDKNGQPNICSINRMMDALRDNVIDAYYMLKVKYSRKENKSYIYFVDILDYIDSLTFNGGTGQIMLMEKTFYETYDSSHTESNLSVEQKSMLIYDLYERKMIEHIKLKQSQLETRRNERILLT